MSNADDRLLAALDAQRAAAHLEREDIRALQQQHSDQEEDGSAHDDRQAATMAAPSMAQYPRHSGPQTGPKGVLADYAHHRQMERERKVAEQRAQMAKFSSPSTTAAKAPQESTLSDQAGDDEEEDEELRELLDELEREDTENDLALQRYREMRIRELRLQRPIFGTLLNIRQDEYVDAIDKEAATTPVIIHLYEPATRYHHAKFLRIRGREADSSFDRVVLPGLLCYRGGELVGNWMRAHEEILADTEQGVGGLGSVPTKKRLIRGPQFTAYHMDEEDD
ncbi:Phosducin-domain-containing protein [Thamnocephalis sphaerospora]|uniref:Phosducin-domain-containing protein n=1 Tax=Thamnocephalis sphaerospora TaxID=78915 RepID=A0A4P9XHM6_9FUNG|nr:Phosducin-domain-containing protein [Thamnocephalis sphaerospora]|eukprot:RKP05168.1 Phosducin-domain-containing protein [Thamnocephalis sphaerospora]